MEGAFSKRFEISILSFIISATLLSTASFCWLIASCWGLAVIPVEKIGIYTSRKCYDLVLLTIKSNCRYEFVKMSVSILRRSQQIIDIMNRTCQLLISHFPKLHQAFNDSCPAFVVYYYNNLYHRLAADLFKSYTTSGQMLLLFKTPGA